MEKNLKVTINKAGEEDILPIVEAHLLSFSDYFLTSLGGYFLALYYRSFLSSDDHLILVARVENKVCGFVAGTIHERELFQNILVKLKENWCGFAVVLAIKFLINSNFRREIWERLAYMRRLKKTLSKSRSKIKAYNKMTATLYSIAVLDELRGKGISVSLMRKFEEEMRKKGVTICTLGVRDDNLRAIRFYRKMGWQEETRRGTTVFFIKSLI